MSIGLEERASGIKIGDFLLNSNAFEIGRSLSEQTISTSDLDQPEVNHVYETTMERFPTDSVSNVATYIHLSCWYREVRIHVHIPLNLAIRSSPKYGYYLPTSTHNG